MPTYYEPREDGLYDVTLPNGTTLPMAIEEEKLKGAGALMRPAPTELQPDPEEPDLRTAQMFSANPSTRTDASDPFGLGAGQPAPPVPVAFSKEEIEAGERGIQEAKKEAAPAAPAAPKATRRLLGDPSEAQQPGTQDGQPGIDQILAPFRGSPGRLVPEKVQQTDIQVQGTKPFDAQYAGELEDAVEAQRQLNISSAQTTSESLRKQALDMEQQNNRLEADLDIERQKRAEIDAEITRLDQEREARRAKLAAMSPIDQNRLMRTHGGATGLLAAIVMGVGSFAEGIGGGRNQAIPLIQDAINRDIEAQKAEVEAARGNLDDVNNQYAELLRIHGSPIQAERELRVQMQDLAGRRAQALALQMQSDEALVNAERLNAQMELEKERELAAMRAEERGVVTERFKVIPAHYVGGQSRLDQALATYKRLGELREAYGKATGTEATDDETTLYWPGTGAELGQSKTTPEKTQEIRQQLAQTYHADQRMAELIEMLKNPSESDVWNGKVKALSADIALTLKGEGGYQLGVLAGPDMEILEAVKGSDPSALIKGLSASDSNIVDRLSQTRKNFREKVKTSLRAQNITRDPWARDPGRK